MGNASSNKVQNGPKDAYKRVGTEREYLAYRHCSLNDIDRNGPLNALMLDCTPKTRGDRSGNLYSAFCNASPRRRQNVDFSLESHALSKFHRRQIHIDGKQCVLDIEETKLLTETVTAQSNQMVDPSIRKCQIFLLCFAVVNRKSFQNALDMCSHIRKEKEAVDDEQYAIAFIVTHCEMREFCHRGSVLSRPEMVERAIANDASYVETSFALRKNTDCAIDLFAHGQGVEVTVDGDFEEKDSAYRPMVHFSDIDLPESEDERVFADVVAQDDGDAQSNSNSAVGVDLGDNEEDGVRRDVDDHNANSRPRRDAMASDHSENPANADISRPLDAPLSNAEHIELDNLLRELQQQSAASEQR